MYEERKEGKEGRKEGRKEMEEERVWCGVLRVPEDGEGM